MPEISVIIPVYNAEKYLRACLDSVLTQTFRDFECICVNDGSPDNSGSILDEYAAKDSRMKVLVQSNQGQGVARNTGVATATGKYLYFLDSDDRIDPDTLQSLYDFAEKNDLDEVIFDFVPEYEDGVNPMSHLHSIRHEYSGVFSGEDLWSKRLLNDDFIACVPLRLFLRDFYVRENLSFRQGVFHEDEVFLFLADFSAGRAGCLNNPFYHYRIRANSTITRQPTFRHFAGLGVAYLEAACFLKNHPVVREDVLKAIAVQKDRWLYAASALMKQIPVEEIQKGCEIMPDMIYFIEMVRLYDRMMATEYRCEVLGEKMEGILHSGSYRLGRSINKCLRPFRKED